MYIIDCSLN